MKHRFTVLDIFRGIFASLVVFYHMSAFSNTPIINNSFVANGDMFVDFFFVLSGFVVCYSYQRIQNGKELKAFLRKRILRLYPLHFVLLVVFVLVELTKIVFQNYVHINNSLDNTLLTFLTSLFLVNSIQFPGVRDLSWNMVSWSISAELISYILFASLCFTLTFFKLDKFKSLFYSFISIIGLFTLYHITNNWRLDYSFNYGFLRGIIGFFAGTVCFYCFNSWYQKLKGLSNILFSFLEIFIVAIIIYFINNGKFYKATGYIYEIIFFISIFIFAFEKGFISKALNKIKILKDMGKYSYSIYMVHTLFISIFNVLFIRLLKLPESSYSYLFIINYLVIYLVSSWTYKNIEMKFQLKKSNK